MSTLPTAVPVLPVADLVRSLAWYERLGFEVRASYDGYGIVAYLGAEVHLAEFDDLPPATETFSGAYLRVVDADIAFAHWTAMGARAIAEPADQFYGIREFATEDLDGNLWRVGAAIEPEEPVVATDDPVVEAPVIEAPALEEIATSEAPTDGSTGTVSGTWFALVAGGVRCAGCGLDPSELHERGLGAEVRDVVHAFGDVLAAADDDLVRARPAPRSWSALEYGVHVRDLLVVFAERIVRTLAEHEPELSWWDHEAAIDDGMANESDVAAVIDDLGRNASKLSEALRMVDGEQWERAAIRPDAERFTIELMARFTLHEVVHHKMDAEAALAAVS